MEVKSIIATKTKVCSICNKELELKYFNRKENGKDGIQSYCRKCGNEKYSYRNKRNITYCGLHNDITGWDIGKATPSNSHSEFRINSLKHETSIKKLL